MKYFLLILLVPTALLAAIPKTSDKEVYQNQRQALMRILELPSANRTHLLETQKSEFYPLLEQIAFDSTQPMQIRWASLMTFTKIGGKQTVPVLKKAGQDHEWFMRNAALIALNEVAPNDAADLARKLLTDKAMVVRSAAAETLGNLKDYSAVNLLWDELWRKRNFRQEQSLWVRKNIVKSLAALSQRGDEVRWMQVLVDNDRTLYPYAIESLERIVGLQLGKKTDSVAIKKDFWEKWWEKKQKI